ncbi:hypothetical protein MGALJ_60060 (plasmid) [Mycobacterium gallinarum]|uniref:Uncharacterized protein n=1 Tax=Mycobacterium gallinarum TaxID=39689 RepID=A0A9W4B9F6_9MYCO|nr:hypothetical protein [Mycobacterium gallinarum]BBY96337.1 hypothetical protein MGALJ_60060 [Mycobacterium gallinarum]
MTGADPYGVHAAVVTAINEMPSAAWEPGHSPGWRAALDSWFDDARAALIEHRTMSLAQHATSAKLGASMPVAARVATSPSVIDAIALITRSDAMNDQTARQSLSTFMVQRDMLTASYMAALCAGGVNSDWRSWLEARIKNWDHSMAAENARRTMRQDHSYLERLPPYW